MVEETSNFPRITRPPLHNSFHVSRTVHPLAGPLRLECQVSHERVLVAMDEDNQAVVQLDSIRDERVVAVPVSNRQQRLCVHLQGVSDRQNRTGRPDRVAACCVLHSTSNLLQKTRSTPLSCSVHHGNCLFRHFHLLMLPFFSVSHRTNRFQKQPRMTAHEYMYNTVFYNFRLSFEIKPRCSVSLTMHFHSGLCQAPLAGSSQSKMFTGATQKNSVPKKTSKRP